MIKLGTNQNIDFSMLNKIAETKREKWNYNNKLMFVRSLLFENGASCNITQNHTPLPKMYRYNIEINPSAFTNFEEYIKFLSVIIPNFQIDEPLITRLDHYVDLELPLSYFRMHATVGRKRCLRDYNPSKTESLIFGRPPEIITIYDKALEAKLVPSTILTRVEVKQRYGKLPIRRLTEIHKLTTYNPFKKILFSKQTLNWAACKNRWDENKFRILKSHIDEVGLNWAKKKLNSCGHFNRDYAIFLTPTYSIDLNQLYQNDVRNFLGRYANPSVYSDNPTIVLPSTISDKEAA